MPSASEAGSCVALAIRPERRSRGREPTWGPADAFHYEYTRWSGDGSITARVLSVEGTHAWAKAGVMFRESAAAGSKQVMAVVSAGKGVAMQYRAATNGISAQAGIRTASAPGWVRPQHQVGA